MPSISGPVIAGISAAAGAVGSTGAAGAAIAGSALSAGASLLMQPKVPKPSTPPPAPNPNDPTVLNAQRQAAAMNVARGQNRQSTILESPGGGNYSSTTLG